MLGYFLTASHQSNDIGKKWHLGIMEMNSQLSYHLFNSSRTNDFNVCCNHVDNITLFTYSDQPIKGGKIVVGVVLFTLVTLTIMGNLAVLMAVLFHRKLRTVSNMFLLSLSMTDLLLGAVVMVPAALHEVFERWILAPKFCPFWVSFDVMLSSASVLNVCLISVDRYIAITSPLRYRSVVTTSRAVRMLIVAWSISAATSFFPVQSGLHNPHVPSLRNLTLFSRTPQCLFIVSWPYALAASSVTILLPICVALTLYYRVSMEARRQAFLVGTLIAPGNVLLGQHVSSKHIREPYTRKATVTLGVIVGAYVATWTPFLVTNLLEACCQCVPGKVVTSVVWLGYCNSLINPVIYPLFMRDFRKVYLSFLYRCCPLMEKITSFRKDRIHRGSQS